MARLLSLFSMISLMLAVPFLTWSGAPRHMSLLMIVTLFMKLPIFCMGLYLATHLPGVSAMACCAGICLTPIAITMKAIGNLRNDYSSARQPAPVEEAEPAAEAEPRTGHNSGKAANATQSIAGVRAGTRVSKFLVDG